MEFAVVKFTEEDDAVGVIPVSWVKETGSQLMAYYPPPEIKDLERCVRRRDAPTIDWPLVNITVIHKYRTYTEARTKLSKAADTSNLSSDEEEARKRRRRQKDTTLPGEESPTPTSHLVTKTTSPFPRFPQLASFIKGGPATSNPPECPTIAATKVQNESYYPAQNYEYTPLSSRAEALHVDTPAVQNGCSKCDQVLYLVKQMQASLADVHKSVQSLHDKVALQGIAGSSSSTTIEAELEETSPELVRLIPVSTLGEMQQLEVMLQDSSSQKQLLKILISMGGRDEKTMIYNSLRRTLRYEVAIEYSYTGRPSKDKFKTKKLSFSKTNLCRIIHVAVRKVYSSANEEKIKTFLGKWLQQAKQRLEKSQGNMLHGDDSSEVAYHQDS